mmetsp:Transcript_40188/g.45300  ORF Transcript_40188/g.45300 Transcript_40188/m.45300 type:complete len:181 (-) Transcript_40188:108-650(-)
MPMHSSNPDKVFHPHAHKVLIFHKDHVPTLLMNAKNAPVNMVRLLTGKQRVEHAKASKKRTLIKMAKGKELLQSNVDPAKYSPLQQQCVAMFKNWYAYKKNWDQNRTYKYCKEQRDKFNPDLFKKFQSQGAYKKSATVIGCQCSESVVLGGSNKLRYQQHFDTDKHQNWKNRGTTAPILR